MSAKGKFNWNVKMYCPNCLETVRVVGEGAECPNCGHEHLLTIQQRMSMELPKPSNLHTHNN